MGGLLNSVIFQTKCRPLMNKLMKVISKIFKKISKLIMSKIISQCFKIWVNKIILIIIIKINNTNKIIINKIK